AAVAAVPRSRYLFAEGTVRPGFVEYLTLQNPGDRAAAVTVAFQAADDGGAPVAVAPLTIAVPSRTRTTINVKDHLAGLSIGGPVNLSAKVTSDQPIVAERPLYFSGDPGVGTVVDGATDVV